MMAENDVAPVDVHVRGLSHVYRTPEGPITVIDGLDLDVIGPAHVAVTGPSGAGKSTLLAVLGGLDRAQEGSITVGGIDVTSLSGDDLARYRRDTVGFVFQHYGLLGTCTALENVELALSFTGGPTRLRRARALELLDAVGLSARASHRPASLSGGEAQRVAVARALANRPRLILADEPTGNLDDDSTERILELLHALPRDVGCTLITVTHNRAVADRADRRLQLRNGRLVDESAPSRKGVA
ncbi:MAG: transporter ATP-binding protein [Actinomycetia bacterium]|nr:transporter ATP-binding protein [Actinomycetes bacterium]